jgi:hypothetical protein
MVSVAARYLGDWQVSTQNQPSLGWRFTIPVPQPNGRLDHKVWILAVPDEESAREKLLLNVLPAEAEAEAVPLSADEVEHFGLEPGEIRRIL